MSEAMSVFQARSPTQSRLQLSRIEEISSNVAIGRHPSVRDERYSEDKV